MQEKLRQRLVGSSVLIALGVIFLPMLLNTPEKPAQGGGDVEISADTGPMYTGPGDFSSSIEPLEVIEPAQADADPPDLLIQDTPAEPDEIAAATETTREPPGAAASPAEPPTPPVTEAPTAIENDWAVQIGSFKQEQNADELRARLAASKFAAFVQKGQTSAGLMFRVRVGPEPTKTAAKALVARLKEDLNLDGIVVRYP